MADPFVAEVRIFAFNFPPKGWAFCNGQVLNISQNTALFALLGTTYGGDGKSTFALPNFQGAAPMQAGQGPGLSNWDLGAAEGTDAVTLLVSEIPFHNHAFTMSGLDGIDNTPLDQLPARNENNLSLFTTTTTPTVSMAPQAIGPAGGSLPHNNMMPYLTLNFCIALQGVFPQRQ